jgi:hypothetical protein
MIDKRRHMPGSARRKLRPGCEGCEGVMTTLLYQLAVQVVVAILLIMIYRNDFLALV